MNLFASIKKSVNSKNYILKALLSSNIWHLLDIDLQYDTRKHALRPFQTDLSCI